MEKVYFIGEYGHFFGQVLPFIEDNPNLKLKIATMESCCNILELLWPDRIKAYSLKEILGRDPDERRRTGIRHLDSKNQNTLHRKGFKNIIELDKDNVFIAGRIFAGDDSKIKRAHHSMKKIIIYGEQLDNKP